MTAARTCPGGAATTGGATSATSRRRGPNWSPRWPRTVTSCCRTRPGNDDDSRQRTRGRHHRGRHAPSRAAPRQPGSGPCCDWPGPKSAMLGRGPLVLAGLIAGAILIWILIEALQPLWWRASWDIGSGQVVLSMAVLASAQLTAGRARRDGMTDLYASFPVSPGRRHPRAPGRLGRRGTGQRAAGRRGRGIRAVARRDRHREHRRAGQRRAASDHGRRGRTALGTRFAHPLAGVIGALYCSSPQ